MASQQMANIAIYQLKATVKDSRPPIWRRFQVPANITLHRLHLILQVVLGWSNSHLYRFEINGTEYGEPHPDNDFYELDFKNSRAIKLYHVAPGEQATFAYRYDFGDDWKHDIRVEKILPVEPGVSYPICIAGRRACPPEDCGAIEGYADLLKALANPRHPEHESTKEWVGGYFDPEAFDLNMVNKALRPRVLLLAR